MNTITLITTRQGVISVDHERHTVRTHKWKPIRLTDPAAVPCHGKAALRQSLQDFFNSQTLSESSGETDAQRTDSG